MIRRRPRRPLLRGAGGALVPLDRAVCLTALNAAVTLFARPKPATGVVCADREQPVTWCVVAHDVLLGVGDDGGRRLAEASLPLVLLILARVCLLVPVAEELLFRGRCLPGCVSACRGDGRSGSVPASSG